jgi:hypothetical protein
VRYERTPLPRYPITYRPANTVVRSSYPPVRQQDPQEVWVELSQVGSFGTGVSNSPTKAPNRSNSQYQPQSANKITLKNPQPPELSKLEAIPSSDKAISFGQSVSAVLETAIAWEGSRGNQGEFNSDDRYILTLNDNSGNTVIPSGSQLVVRLEGTNNAIANLVAESIIIDRQETKLTQGALKVRGEEGQALIPKVKKLGGNSRDDAEFLTDILSVAGDFADIPGSRSINSLYRTLTGGRNRGGSGVTTTIFYLPQGTRVEVFVNKSFSVDSPEQPLELDFSNELNYSEGE